MRLVRVHAVLLLAALALAYQTWTDRSNPLEPGSVALWNEDPDDIASIVYEDEPLRVVLERREDEEGAYLWGTVTRAAPTTETPAPPAEPMQFLVGEYTEMLLATLADMRALRDLGEVGAEREQEYGLAGAAPRLVVDFGGRTRELSVGGAAFGTSDRYVKDAASGSVYVIPGIPIENLEAPEVGLPDRRPHAFQIERVATVTVRTARGERTMRRSASAAAPGTWTPPDAPELPDQTFANFMERLQQLWITEYTPATDRSRLQSLARVEYFDANGRVLGHLELLRSGSEQGAEYYLVTEHTRALAKVSAEIAETLDQDVMQLL